MRASTLTPAMAGRCAVSGGIGRLLLASVVLFAAAGRGQALEPAKVEAIERLVSTFMSKQGIPGLSIAVAVDGAVVWSGAYGFADVENFVPAKTTTLYRTASMGKTVTATAAMRLVEQGKLDLERPIQAYCPAFPAKPWPVTARQLMSHTTGIRHYGGPHDAEEQTSTVHYANVVDALAPFKDDPLLFEPGTQSLYSTYGFDVLGCVVQGAAGLPFLDAMRQLVLAPAGMVRARDDDPFAIIPDRAAGYQRVGGELRNAPHVDMSNRMPAGGYLTTAPELAGFAARFMDCKLVSCATRDRMLTETALKNGDTVNYGLGWAIDEDAAGHVTGRAFHGGSSPGASGMLFIDPARRVAVVFMSNLEATTDRLDMVTAVADIARTQVKGEGASP